jgi:hypothetical protein
MTRILFLTAALLGAAAILWIGSGFAGSNTLALAVTAVIGCVYLIGIFELLQFRWATSTLSQALGALPARPTRESGVLDGWLERLHPSLRNTVRLRIEGERVGLPAPVFTPYLVGLLVMLGLLGTFAGLVDTLKGAVAALQGTTELEAIRAGLAAPIEGLGVAFGTSVAGVAASAMLGLSSTLSRRERLLATARLDADIATVFRNFTLSHNRLETYRALQAQAEILPDLAEKLGAMAQRLERTGENLSERLLAGQERLHQAVQGVFTELAASVDASLRENLADSGRQAGESLLPAVREAIAGISAEARQTHQHVTATAREQFETLAGRLTQTSEEIAGALRGGLSAQERTNEALVAGMASAFEAFNGRFESASTAMLESFDGATAAWVERQAAGDRERLAQWSDALTGAAAELAENARSDSTALLSEIGALLASTEALVTARRGAEDSWLAAHGERMAELSRVVRAELTALRESEERLATAAVERLAGLEAAAAAHLSGLGQALEAPMNRLIQTASETPRAAAEVIAQLRQQISNNIERDNALLEERDRLMERIDSLVGSLERSAGGQLEAMEEVVRSSGTLLKEIGFEFSGHVDAEAARLSEIAAVFAGNAAEIASLGDTFSYAVKLFNSSNESLMESLAGIGDSLKEATARSDEQMGYYVAQAREIIDQSMLSQQEVIEELRQFGRSQDRIPAEVS